MSNKYVNKILIFLVISYFNKVNTSTIKFHSPQAAIVLNNSKTYFGVPSLSSIEGWYQQNILQEYGKQNIKTFGSTLTYSCAPNQQINNYLYQPELTNDSELNLNEKTIYLSEDIFIPNSSSLKITSSGILDGQNKTLHIGEYSQIYLDNNVNVTFKNLILKNDYNSTVTTPILLGHNNAQITFDNCKTAFDSNFTFTSRMFFVNNNFNITGLYELTYKSTDTSHVLPHSSLIFEPGTTFNFAPNSPDKKNLNLVNETSKIKFNNASLSITNSGLNLTKGQLKFDNKVTITQTLPEVENISFLTQHDYGNHLRSVKWSPNENYLAIGGFTPPIGGELQVYSFNGSSLSLVDSVNYGVIIRSIDWSPDGNYLAIGGESPLNNNELQIYSFNGTSLSLVDSVDYGATIYSLSWKSDGNYLAIGGQTPISGDELQVYSFNGTSLSLVDSANFGNIINSLGWRSDGNYLAIGGQAPISGDELQVYSFNGTTLTFVTSENFGTSISSVIWNPNNKNIAVGGSSPLNNNELQIYSFDEINLNLLDSINYGDSDNIYSVSWDSNGNYIVFGGQTLVAENEIKIYKFDQKLFFVASIELNNLVTTLDWSTNSKYIAEGGSHSDVNVYELQYNITSDPPALNNGLTLGNSNLGSNYDLSTFINGDSRVELSTKLVIDNTTSSENNLNFANKNASLVLKNPDAKLHVTNNEGISGWEQYSIIKDSNGDNVWINSNTTYGFEGGETKPTTDLISNNSNAIITHVNNDIKWNSNAIINQQENITNNSNSIVNNKNNIKYNSNAIVSTDATIVTQNMENNSNAILMQDDKIRWNSNTIINNAKPVEQNSNAILDLKSQIPYISNTTINSKNNIGYNSNVIINNKNNIINNSNAIINNKNNIDNNLNDIKYNSNAILLHQDKIRYNSNTILNNAKPVLQNSDTILNLKEQVLYISNVTINNSSNISYNSNTIINNKYSIRYNSSAIINNKDDISSNLNNIRYNSSAILVHQNKIRWNSNAIISTDVASLEQDIRENSNAIVSSENVILKQKIANNSNATINLEDDIRNNSNAIETLTTPRLETQINHNSSAIIEFYTLELSENITNNSNAIINHNNYIKYNSNAIISASIAELEQDIINNSNAIIKHEEDIKNNSNSIITNKNYINYNSNAISNFEDHLIYTSYASIENSTKIGWNSNAIISNKNNIHYNSNTILTNKSDISNNNNYIRYNSNSIIYFEEKIKHNSDSIINLDYDNLTKNNSNSIILFKEKINYISNATIRNNNQIAYNSNAIVNYNITDLQDKIRHNSEAIINLETATLEEKIKNNSNTIVYNDSKIHYNSQSIVHDYEITPDLTDQIRHNSSTIINSQALEFKNRIRHNSNAIIYFKKTEGDTILTENPITGDITLKRSIFINTDERIFIQDNAIIDGNGVVIVFSDPKHAQFIVTPGKTVTLKNIQLLRINQNTFDLRYNAYVDSNSPSGWTLDDGQIKIGQNVLFGLSENITMSQGLIEIINNDNSQAQTFQLKGIEGQKQFQITPSDNYSNALSKADNGLSWNQRKGGYTSAVPFQLPERFHRNDTIPVLVKCNDNTFGIQSINLSGFEHISKTETTNYTGAIGLLGNSYVDIGDCTFTEFEKNRNLQEHYDMVFVIQSLDNKLRLLKDDLLFSGQIQFADYGENVLTIDSILTERIRAKAGSLDLTRSIPQINFATDFINLTSKYGTARLIFANNRIRINNRTNAFVVDKNSYLAGNTIEVTGDPIWDNYNPASGEKEFILDVNELIGLDDIDNQPIITNSYLLFRNKNLKKKKARTALDLIYEQELEIIFYS